MKSSGLGQVVRTCVLLVVILSSAQTGGVAAAARRTCQELRQEITRQYELELDLKPSYHDIISQLVDLSLPSRCARRNSLKIHTDPGATQEDPRATKRPYEHVAYSTFLKEIADTRPRHGATEKSGRSTAELAIKNTESTARAKRDTKINEALLRKRRFLGVGSTIGGPDFSSMSLGSPSSGPPGKEISESAQMMNNLLMLSKFQKSRLAQEYSTIGRQGGSYVGDRVSFGSGVYGDSFPGRKRREAVDQSAQDGNTLSSAPERNILRKKRFLFAAEPTEGAPSLLSVFMGTAADPNTGKRVELGGDYMKRAMGNAFMSFLPPGLQPSPGKEPGDFAKNADPLWYFSAFGSSGTSKKRNKNGLFGDSLPGKRRKRSSEDSGNSDVVRFGDVSIPLDLLENRGEQQNPPPPPPPPNRPTAVYLINLPAQRAPLYSLPPAYTTNPLPSLPSVPYIPNPLYNQPLLLPPGAASPLLHGRKKRAASNSDVVTFGDISIPVEFFKAPERQEEKRYEPEQQNQQSPSSYQSQQRENNDQKVTYQTYPTNPNPNPRPLNSLIPAQQQPPQSSSYSFVPPPSPLSSSRPAVVQVYQNLPPVQPPPNIQPHAPIRSRLTQNVQSQLPLSYSPLPYKPLSYNPHPQPSIQPPQTPPRHQLPPQSSPPPLPSPPSVQSQTADVVDPFTPWQPATDFRRQRAKRSADNNDQSGSQTYQPFPTPLFSPQFPPLYGPASASAPSNKMAHRSPSGDVVYGDRMPWQSSPVPSTPQSFPAAPNPTLNLNPFPAGPTSSVFNNLALPFQPQLSGFQQNQQLFAPPQSPGIIYSPSNTFSPRQSQSTKVGYSTGRGGVVYGDRLP